MHIILICWKRWLPILLATRVHDRDSPWFLPRHPFPDEVVERIDRATEHEPSVKAFGENEVGLSMLTCVGFDWQTLQIRRRSCYSRCYRVCSLCVNQSAKNRDSTTPKFPRVPQEGNCCRGGSRYVEGWWESPNRKFNNLGSLVSLFPFEASKSQRLKKQQSFDGFGNRLIPCYPIYISCFWKMLISCSSFPKTHFAFLAYVDFISKIFQKY